MQTVYFGQSKQATQETALFKLVERELDLKVLYCVGDEAGPLAGEVSLGVASRKTFAGAIETAQRWRSEKLAIHFQHIIRGEGPYQRLRAELENLWRPSWRRGSWWEKSGQAAALEVVSLAAAQRIPLLTDADAVELEQRKFQEVFSRITGV
jgi:hypothetical protein